jgi:hypothetical protein
LSEHRSETAPANNLKHPLEIKRAGNKKRYFPSLQSTMGTADVASFDVLRLRLAMI